MIERSGKDVLATLDYLRDPPTDDPSTTLCYYTEDRSKTTMRVVPVEVRIADGRPNVAAFDLDLQGFKLVSHRSSITDFLDRDQVNAVYAGEMAELIRAVTGARHAVAYGVGVRFGRKRTDYVKTNDDRPARFPHADFTDETSVAVLSHLDDGLGKPTRRAIYNVWRVFSDPPQDYPLAVCDARSTSRSDEEQALAVLDFAGVEEPFQSLTTVYRPNPGHRWTYFSDMNVGEALIFRAWDSNKSQFPRVPHSSFANPLVGSDAPSRCSIEARVVAYFT